jgi:hypothetical protein
LQKQRPPRRRAAPRRGSEPALMGALGAAYILDRSSTHLVGQISTPARRIGHPGFVPFPAAVAPTIAMTVPIRSAVSWQAQRHHRAGASRPASVIVSQITLISCRPARISRCSAVASPCRTKASSIAFVKPEHDRLGERRRLPPPPPLPSKLCAQCQRPFRPGRRGTGKVAVKFCSRRCQLRARDDRRLALERAKRNQRRSSATVTLDCAPKLVYQRMGCGCGVSFRQLQTCRAARPGRQWARTCRQPPSGHTGNRCSFLRELPMAPMAPRRDS